MTDGDATARGERRSAGRDGSFVRSLFADAGPRYDAVVRASTLGMDALWKRRMHAAVPDDREYGRVLDLACGTGIVTRELARRHPQATVVGLDASPEMLAVARDRVDAGNVRLVAGRAEDADALTTGGFDLVTASYLPKYVDRERLAAVVRAVLRPGGVAVCHDFTYPRSWPYPAGFDAYWGGLRRLVARVPGYEAIAAELDDLLRENAGWPEELRDALGRAGFDRVRVDWQPLEIAAIVVAVDEATRTASPPT